VRPGWQIGVAVEFDLDVDDFNILARQRPQVLMHLELVLAAFLVVQILKLRRLSDRKNSLAL